MCMYIHLFIMKLFLNSYPIASDGVLLGVPPMWADLSICLHYAGFRPYYWTGQLGCCTQYINTPAQG